VHEFGVFLFLSTVYEYSETGYGQLVHSWVLFSMKMTVTEWDTC